MSSKFVGVMPTRILVFGRMIEGHQGIIETDILPRCIGDN